MNAEDCPKHRDQIDETIFYPWTCSCESLDKVAWDEGQPNMAICLDCEAVFPLVGDLSNPADEGWCTLCEGPVERL